MKIWLGICLFVSVFALGGCSKDADAEAFVKENDELGKAIKDAKDPAEAKKAWDSKKDAIKTKYDSLKDARGFQVKEENTKKMGESMGNTAIVMCTTSDELCKDYKSTIGLDK